MRLAQKPGGIDHSERLLLLTVMVKALRLP